MTPREELTYLRKRSERASARVQLVEALLDRARSDLEKVDERIDTLETQV